MINNYNVPDLTSPNPLLELELERSIANVSRDIFAASTHSTVAHLGAKVVERADVVTDTMSPGVARIIAVSEADSIPALVTEVEVAAEGGSSSLKLAIAGDRVTDVETITYRYNGNDNNQLNHNHMRSSSPRRTLYLQKVYHALSSVDVVRSNPAEPHSGTDYGSSRKRAA